MFGVNLRKHKIFSNKKMTNAELRNKLNKQGYQRKIDVDNEQTALFEHRKLIHLINNENASPITNDNKVKLLVNGESKFPELLDAMKAAKNHIHLEYYIYEDDKTGQEIEEILIQKAKEGIEVRFIFDDLGSRSIKSRMVPSLLQAGVDVIPFFDIKYMLLANRINYRNHRKITVIDGHTAFVGGINVGDNYVNKDQNKEQQFWRDSHLLIQGSAVHYLQYLFIADYNHCKGDDFQLTPTLQYFPEIKKTAENNKYVQIAASGPDSDTPSVMHSILQAINLAKSEIQITTPYFVPNEAIMDGLCIAARSGILVKLLVPCKGDSYIVDAASEFYYERLLEAGISIYMYEKGFIHSKSLVIDEKITIIGTANMDVRSFDLNFEVNAIVYDEDLAKEMKTVFQKDIDEATKVDKDRWKDRSMMMKMKQNIARLFSPIL
tara:strand:- start:356 stop:1660 length:1305 start_codon:yes stop_codon:yes gene_type:complete